MAGPARASIALAFCLLASSLLSIEGALSLNYYNKTCPTAEKIITSTVTAAFSKDNTLAAALIRLFFHDCFVRGCDASVLLDGPDVEKLGAPNANSLRGFEVIDQIKANLEAACPTTVSCADILSFAARDSINLAKGTPLAGNWYGGRKDGSVSVSSETLTELPAPFASYPQLVAAFGKKGLSTSEMITLSGAHTVGRAHCGVILSRLYNYQGTQQPDPRINKSYLTTLQSMCPPTSPGSLVNMEMATPTIVDKNYFEDVVKGRGMFESDANIYNTTAGKLQINILRVNAVFTQAFSNAMVKMSKIELKLGAAGNIRVNCNTTAGAVPGPQT